MFNMSSRYSSRYQYRSAKRYKTKSKRNFIATIIIIFILLYVAFFWILPSLIGGLGSIRNSISPSQKKLTLDPITLAPPVFNIPFEATNTAQIDITGYGIPNSKVEFFLDDAKKDTTEASEDGSFGFKNISLSLGTNNIYGKSVDEKGIESLASKTLIVLFDNEKPDLSIDEPEDNKEINGGDKKIKISGKTEVEAKVFINNNQLILSGDGHFSTTLELADGDNNFDIKAVDKANNSNEVSRKVIFQPTQ